MEGWLWWKLKHAAMKCKLLPWKCLFTLQRLLCSYPHSGKLLNLYWVCCNLHHSSLQLWIWWFVWSGCTRWLKLNANRDRVSGCQCVCARACVKVYVSCPNVSRGRWLRGGWCNISFFWCMRANMCVSFGIFGGEVCSGVWGGCACLFDYWVTGSPGETCLTSSTGASGLQGRQD